MDDRLYKFTLTRVVNGDTVEGFVDLGFNISTKQRFRLDGIVAPSLRSENDDEKERAKAAKMWLSSRLSKKQIIIRSRKANKFGHYLAMLFIDGSNVNEELLSAGHAFKFSVREKSNETED